MFTPLKCYPAVTKTSLFLHTIGAAIFTYGIYYDRTQLPDNPIFLTFGGRFKYLTMINVYFTCGASWFAFLVDILQSVFNWCDPEKAVKKKWSTKSTTSPCIRMRDELMSSWLFMSSSLVTFLFWGIAAVDLEGIHPPEQEKIFPLLGWYNNFLHTFPFVYSFLLVTRVNYRYKPLITTVTQTVVVVTLYFAWLAYCATMNGVWAYGFLRKLSPKEFAVFVIFCNVAAILVQLLGRFIASCVWNKLVDLTEIERKRY